MTETTKADERTELVEMTEPSRSSAQITQEKISTREHLIEKLHTLFSYSFNKGTKPIGRGGLAANQKWFAISASLAHTLARLLSDLEYEKMRLEVDDLKNMVLETSVPNQRIPFPQARHGLDQETRGKQKT